MKSVQDLRSIWLSVSHFLVAILGLIFGLYHTLEVPTAIQQEPFIFEWEWTDIFLRIFVKFLVLVIGSLFAMVASFCLFSWYPYLSMLIGFLTIIVACQPTVTMNPFLFIMLLTAGVFQILFSCFLCKKSSITD